MKLKILKKTVKEGVTANGAEYSIKSLYVGFSETSIYEAIVSHLRGLVADDEMIEKFCKPNEYNGQISYAFGLNCSHFTFDSVDKFGILDANIIFGINEKGFINAKIQVLDRKEQVNSYESPEDLVTGWSCGGENNKDFRTPVAEKEVQVIPDIPDFLKMENQDVVPF